MRWSMLESNSKELICTANNSRKATWFIISFPNLIDDAICIADINTLSIIPIVCAQNWPWRARANVFLDPGSSSPRVAVSWESESVRSDRSRHFRKPLKSRILIVELIVRLLSRVIPAYCASTTPTRFLQRGGDEEDAEGAMSRESSIDHTLHTLCKTNTHLSNKY